MHDSSSAISTAFNSIIKKATSSFKGKKNKIEVDLELKENEIEKLKKEWKVLDETRDSIKKTIAQEAENGGMSYAQI
jgi:hypothetical protein